MDDSSRGLLLFGWVLEWEESVSLERLQALQQRLRPLGDHWVALRHGAPLDDALGTTLLVGVPIAAAQPDPWADEEGVSEAEDAELFDVLDAHRVPQAAVSAARESFQAQESAALAALAPFKVDGAPPEARLYVTLTGHARRTLVRTADRQVYGACPEAGPEVHELAGDLQLLVL